MATAQALKTKRVLVVDDQRDTLDIVEMVLLEAGATVVVASSAGEALTRMQESSFDLIVSDIGMPEMDGYALAPKLRAIAAQRGADLRLVAFTAFSEPSDRKRVLASGFDAHIAKPVDPVALVSLVQSLLQLA